MPEYSGFPHVTFSGSLWLVLAPPLVGALYLLYEKRNSMRVGVGAIALSFAAALYETFLLARAPDEERTLVEHLWRVVRVGQLDVNFDLAFDPLTSVVCLLVTGIGTLAALHAAGRVASSKEPWRIFAWLDALVFGTLLWALADNLALYLVGWVVASVASGSALRAFLRQRAADVMTVVAMAALFWGLGGAWTASEYTPDLSPRLAAAAVGPAEEGEEKEEERKHPAVKDSGFLTLDAYPGALVFADESRVPMSSGGGEPLRAPFARLETRSGYHGFRVHPGSGLDDYVVSRVLFRDKKEIDLALFGPTVTFRHVRQQLEARSAGGDLHTRDVFESRELWRGARVVTVVCLLLFVAAILMGMSVRPPEEPPIALVAQTSTAIAGVYLLLRLGILFDGSRVASAVATCVGAFGLVVAPLVASTERDSRRVLAWVSTSQLGLALVGLGTGARTGAAFALVVHALSMACLILLADAIGRATGTHELAGAARRRPPRRIERAFFAAAVALTVTSGVWPLTMVASAALDAARRPIVPSWCVVVAAACGAATTSFAVWRAYHLVFAGKAGGTKAAARGPATADDTPRMTRALGVLAACAAVIGPLLGVGADPLFADWLEPALGRVGAYSWAFLALAVGAAILGWAAARARFGDARPPDWEERERATLRYRLFHRVDVETPGPGLAGRAVLRLRHFVVDMDRWVLGGVVGAAAALARALAWVCAQIDERVLAGPFDALARRLARFLVVLVAVGASLTLSRTASAELPGTLSARGPADPGGKIVLGQGPLELAPKEGGYAGTFTITNAGPTPLAISRVAVRGDADDVRTPMHVSTRVEGGIAQPLPPGATKTVTVSWMPDKEPRMKQVFGHVVVTSSDEAAGEVAMGFAGRLASPFSLFVDHALTWLVVLPLLGALAAVVTRSRRRATGWIMIGVAALECAVALFLLSGFSPEVTHFDGNDGMQFVEHVSWIRALPTEYFVGVDGASIGLILLAALVALVAAIAGLKPRGDAAGAAASMLVLGATMGILVSLDLVLLFTFWELAILGAFLLVASSGAPDRVRRAQSGVKVAVFGAFGSVLLLSAILLLYRHSDRTFLVDGTTTLQSFSIPELARVAYLKKGILVAGVPFVKVVFTLLLLGFGVLVPIFPLHTWLPDALATAPTSGAVTIAGALLGAGPYAILRVAVTILPEAARWAAGGVVLLGVVNVFYGGLCAMAQRDLRRMLAYGAMSHMGFCLVGIGSLTPQGMMGALVQVFAQGTIVALLFVLVGVLETRTESSDLTRFGGLARETPVLAGLFALGLAASMGLPALAGFWGELLAILGAFPTQRGLAFAAAVALLLHVAYHATAIARLLFGAFPEAWRASARLEPTGGKLPEIGSREIAAVAPLAVLTVVLGIWPAPLLSLISGGVRDLDSVVNPPGPEQLACLPRGCKGARCAEKPPT